MRLARELRSPLTPALALMAGALFFGGNLGDGNLPWLGLAAVALALVLLGTGSRPDGLRVLVPLWLLAGWCAVSVSWSIEPDRSWSYANRAFVYAAFALVGALLPVTARRLFEGVCLLLGAVCVWSLLGKVFPWLYEGYGQIARLRSPIGYWNSLALVGAIALPLGLCLARDRRVLGTLLVFAWLVAVGLTYSRGGILVAVVVVAAWMVLSGAWIDALATLVAAALPAAAALAAAVILPGVTSDNQPHAMRVHDGLAFGAVLLATGVAAGFLARIEPPVELPRATRRGLVVALALLCAGALVGGGLEAQRLWDSFTSPTGGEITNSAGRLTATGSNFRSSWWKEAWRGFESSPLRGTGAGSFQFTNERYQTNNLDDAQEPHDLPLQFLTETGVVGLVLFAVATIWLMVAARRSPGPELALALALPAYLLHTLLDIDWDVAAVSAPVFLIAGYLAVRPAEHRRTSPFAVLAAAGASVALLVSLFAIWLGERWTNEAGLTNNPVRMLSFVREARAVDPLSVEPLYQGAIAEELIAGSLPPGRAQARAYAAALGYYEQATRVQPENANAWYQLGEFNLTVRGCPRAAYSAFNRSTVLSGQNPLYSTGYAAALAKVNSGRYAC